jgi:hypothetical protein
MSYDVGDILSASWGYDQTNIDFYRIVRRTNDTVWLEHLTNRHVEATGWASETVMPGEPDGTIIRRKLARWGPDNEIHGCRFASTFGWISAWDGKPEHASHYA